MLWREVPGSHARTSIGRQPIRYALTYQVKGFAFFDSQRTRPVFSLPRVLFKPWLWQASLPCARPMTERRAFIGRSSAMLPPLPGTTGV